MPSYDNNRQCIYSSASCALKSQPMNFDGDPRDSWHVCACCSLIVGLILGFRC
ncbi:hypothetical protein BDR06DRAFT_959725 [Suillus hirtellus]|nr:hypothetical protein BDR06DRAFT_959725 [Suillus hirtellus]